MIQALTDILFVIVGLLSYPSANFVGRLFSDTADRGNEMASSNTAVDFRATRSGEKIARSDLSRGSKACVSRRCLRVSFSGELALFLRLAQ
jgi:hypothetical protein